jgi:DNA-binding transcriptional LysR family regulator
MDKLEAMRVFVEVTQANSFVAASRKLGISAPAVTRSIAQFEKTLGVRLFNRTTRHVRLTDSGIRFYQDAKRILDDVDQSVAAVSGSYTEPKGLLTITAPVLFGQLHVTSVITEYLQQHPSVSVRAVFYDRISNLLDEGLDIAIRIGQLKDSSIYAIPVGSVHRVLCASPRYLAKHGSPKHPNELVNHEIIQASTVEPSTTWQFESATGKTSTKVNPRLQCSQNGAAIEAAKQGLGITRLMSYQVGEELKNGSLTCVLANYQPPPLPVSIVHIEGRQAHAKIRSFIDLAVARLRANPFIDH